MNKFTLIIHNKGWKVLDACEHWGIRYATYNARCNSDKFHNQLECMCNGLIGKLDERDMASCFNEILKLQVTSS